MAENSAALAAPPEEKNPAAASPTAGDPAANGSSGAPATASENESQRTLREIKAQHGRVEAELRRQAEEANRQVVALGTQYQNLQRQVQAQGAHLSERAQKEREAYLASLPADRRIAEEVKLLKTQLSALTANRSAPAAPAAAPKRPATPEEVAAYTARRSQELIQATNREFGLDGDTALTGEEDELDWDSEDSYKGSIRALARTRKNGASPVTKKADETAEQMEARITQKVLSDLGVQGSNAAKAASSGNGVATIEELQSKNFSYKSSRGMIGQRKEMERLREEARTARGR